MSRGSIGVSFPTKSDLFLLRFTTSLLKPRRCLFLEKYTEGGGWGMVEPREGLHGPLEPGPVKLTPRCGPGRPGCGRIQQRHFAHRAGSQAFRWRSSARDTHTLPPAWPGQTGGPRSQFKQDTVSSSEVPAWAVAALPDR